MYGPEVPRPNTAYARIVSINVPGVDAMIRPRFTILRVMALILACALLLGLGLPAYEVYRAEEYHVHTGIDASVPTMVAAGGIWPPFWPRYRRCLTGRPWRGRGPCGTVIGYELELCEFAHPEMRVTVGSQSGYQVDPEQFSRVEELRRARGSP